MNVIATQSMSTSSFKMQEGVRLLRMPQVIERVSLKRTVIYERIKAGTFPRPIKLGSASAWPEHEVDKWIMEQIRQQRAALHAT